jgi:glycosyltransferase involved in cell wall biosynthesis
MSVYNGEKYLREAINSILNQTFTDFELIIINDGSTDDTLKIIKSYKDPRIVLVSRKNKGLVASLNEGINKAKGKYIARQDADDVSLPNRLEKQLSYIDSGENIVLVSSAFVMFSKNPDKPFATHYLIDDDSLLKRIINVKNPFAHGATMFKRDAAIRAGLYRDVGPIEDYDLWIRLMDSGQFMFINQVLYCWRINPEGITQTKADEQQAAAEYRAASLNVSSAPKLNSIKLIKVFNKYRLNKKDSRQYIKTYLFDFQIKFAKKCFLSGNKKRGIVELFISTLIQPDFLMYVLKYVKNRILGNDTGKVGV